MAKNGPLFLKRTRTEFLEDLRDSFGDKSEGFTDELRVLLFEMWVRARSRPPFPVHRPEPTDEMRRAELIELLTPILTSLSTEPGSGDLRRALVQVVQQVVITGQGSTRFDNTESLELKLDTTRELMDQHQFAQHLDKALQLDPGTKLAKYHDTALGQVELELSPDASSSSDSSSAGIPELGPGLETDESQEHLKERLEKLGVLAPSSWVPVFQHTESGARAGIDVPALERQVPRELETWLVHDGCNWLFPHPKPVYTWDECIHIRMWVDGIDQLNNLCVWQHSTDGVGTDAVDSVMIPGTTGSQQVKAVYTTVTKEYGV